MRPTTTYTGKIVKNLINVHVFNSEYWRQHPLERIALKDDDSLIQPFCTAIVKLSDGELALAILEQVEDRVVILDPPCTLVDKQLENDGLTIIHVAEDYWANTFFTKTNCSMLEGQAIGKHPESTRARKEILVNYKTWDTTGWNVIVHCIKRIGDPLEYRFNDRYMGQIGQLSQLARSFL